MQFVTANRLIEGLVVFRDADGRWVENFGAVAILTAPVLLPVAAGAPILTSRPTVLGPATATPEPGLPTVERPGKIPLARTAGAIAPETVVVTIAIARAASAPVVIPPAICHDVVLLKKLPPSD